MRVPEIENLVQQFINEDEIVLDSLLVHFAEIRPSNAIDKTMQKLKDQRCIRIDLGDGDNVNVVSLDVEEGRAAESRDGRANVGGGEDVDAKDIGNGSFEVVSVQTRDENLALLIEDEDS